MATAEEMSPYYKGNNDLIRELDRLYPQHARAHAPVKAYKQAELDNEGVLQERLDNFLEVHKEYKEKYQQLQDSIEDLEEVLDENNISFRRNRKYYYQTALISSNAMGELALNAKQLEQVLTPLKSRDGEKSIKLEASENGDIVLQSGHFSSTRADEILEYAQNVLPQDANPRLYQSVSGEYYIATSPMKLEHKPRKPDNGLDFASIKKKIPLVSLPKEFEEITQSKEDILTLQRYEPAKVRKQLSDAIKHYEKKEGLGEFDFIFGKGGDKEEAFEEHYNQIISGLSTIINHGAVDTRSPEYQELKRLSEFWKSVAEELTTPEKAAAFLHKNPNITEQWKEILAQTVELFEQNNKSSVHYAGKMRDLTDTYEFYAGGYDGTHVGLWYNADKALEYINIEGVTNYRDPRIRDDLPQFAKIAMTAARVKDRMLTNGHLKKLKHHSTITFQDKMGTVQEITNLKIVGKEKPKTFKEVLELKEAEQNSQKTEIEKKHKETALRHAREGNEVEVYFNQPDGEKKKISFDFSYYKSYVTPEEIRLAYKAKTSRIDNEIAAAVVEYINELLIHGISPSLPENAEVYINSKNDYVSEKSNDICIHVPLQKDILPGEAREFSTQAILDGLKPVADVELPPLETFQERAKKRRHTKQHERKECYDRETLLDGYVITHSFHAVIADKLHEPIISYLAESLEIPQESISIDNESFGLTQISFATKPGERLDLRDKIVELMSHHPSLEHLGNTRSKAQLEAELVRNEKIITNILAHKDDLLILMEANQRLPESMIDGLGDVEKITTGDEEVDKMLKKLAERGTTTDSLETLLEKIRQKEAREKAAAEQKQRIEEKYQAAYGVGLESLAKGEPAVDMRFDVSDLPRRSAKKVFVFGKDAEFRDADKTVQGEHILARGTPTYAIYDSIAPDEVVLTSHYREVDNKAVIEILHIPPSMWKDGNQHSLLDRIPLIVAHEYGADYVDFSDTAKQKIAAYGADIPNAYIHEEGEIEFSYRTDAGNSALGGQFSAAFEQLNNQEEPGTDEPPVQKKPKIVVENEKSAKKPEDDPQRQQMNTEWGKRKSQLATLRRKHDLKNNTPIQAVIAVLSNEELDTVEAMEIPSDDKIKSLGIEEKVAEYQQLNELLSARRQEIRTDEVAAQIKAAKNLINNKPTLESARKLLEDARECGLPLPAEKGGFIDYVSENLGDMELAIAMLEHNEKLEEKAKGKTVGTHPTDGVLKEQKSHQL